VKEVYRACVIPNQQVSRWVTLLFVIAQVGLALLLWSVFRPAIIPGPMQVLQAYPRLFNEQGLGYDLLVSVWINVQALALASVISLGLAYLTVLAPMRPLVAFVAKLRFLSLAGVLFVLMMVTNSGLQLKLSVLVLAVSVFFVTSMADVVASVPRERFDDARTLRMNEWRVVWEVVVLGQRHQAMDVLRQNAAIGWMMVTMVEGLVRSEGGVGVLLLNESRQLHFDAVFAIQVMILGVGLFQDWALARVKRIVAPYAHLTLERR
jgi:NitT/TauT family transport system permease protein